MQQFHFKSIVLGIGIGIILAAILSMIYTAGMTPHLSREEIMKKAAEYGMVEKTSLLQEETANPERPDGQGDNPTAPVPSATAGSEATPAPGQNQKEQQKVPVKVQIIISAGDTSERVAVKLYEAGLVDSREEFERKIQESKLTGSIRIGTYEIDKGTDIPTILRIITNKK